MQTDVDIDRFTDAVDGWHRVGQGVEENGEGTRIHIQSQDSTSIE